MIKITVNWLEWGKAIWSKKWFAHKTACTISVWKQRAQENNWT